MTKKVNIYVIHYSRLKDRYSFFLRIKQRNISFTFITEKDVLKNKSIRKLDNLTSIQIDKWLKAVHLGHVANILKSRTLAKYVLEILAAILRVEFHFFQKQGKMYQRFIKYRIFSTKLNQINMMHASALISSAKQSKYSIILEDDSIFQVKTFHRNIKNFVKFLEKNPNSIIFFTDPAATIHRTIEDLIHFKKKYIKVIPPMSKGAGAYILSGELAERLGDYIITSKIGLPIDLLLNYWVQENRINVYWERVPTVTEGSGEIYKSSLRKVTSH
jgi:GR25 family glycosyltransferase involved in LPS biosynthesis